MNQFSLGFFIAFGFLTSAFNAQQRYSGKSILACNSSDATGPSPDFLYTCNREKQSCQAFLIFRSQPPYDSVAIISNLTASDPLELARINNIPSFARVVPGTEVVVPVTCSCFGEYYQANTSYVVVKNDTYYEIAFNKYQGLSTCDALMKENVYNKFDLQPGMKLQVPLRCACPNSNQVLNGTNFLLTYLVTSIDTVPNISKRFNISIKNIVYANGFSEEDPKLYALTTILIPLSDEPSSQAKIYPPSVDVATPSPETPDHRNRKSKKEILIGIGTGTGIFLAALCFLLFVVFSHHKRKKTDEAAGKNKERKRYTVLPEDILVGIAAVDQVLKVYDYKDLEEATENFSLQNRLSDSVYQGVLWGKMFAIKKMSTDISKEVKILKKINHFNLISLYGACEHHGCFYLVYEFMENGSLKEWLCRKSYPEIQSWNHRIRIAWDIANGLHYIHNFTNPAYVHKDVNSRNILLDRNLRAKIANFSLARSAEREENGNSCTRCALGTKGYMAPEYIETCEVTPKMDVYAFGVVLLELVTGREPVFKQDGKDVLLSEAVVSIMEGEDAEAELRNMMDPCLQVKHPLGFIIDQTELVLRMVKLSIACLAPDSSRRLSMAEVVSSLTRIQLDAQKPEPLSIESL